jgi:hypothetical protein
MPPPGSLHKKLALAPEERPIIAPARPAPGKGKTREPRAVGTPELPTLALANNPLLPKKFTLCSKNPSAVGRMYDWSERKRRFQSSRTNPLLPTICPAAIP